MLSRYGIFCKVIDTGSFTKAAEIAGYSQSAVSQTVKSIERELGSVLINRGKDGVSLTSDGESYMPYIRAIYSSEKALAKKRREMLGLENSTIRIGTFSSVSQNLLPNLIQQFKTQYPNIHFILKQGEYTSISKWIKDGSVDFGFVNMQSADGLIVQKFYHDEMMAVLPASHPLAKQEVVSLAQLADEPFILLDEGEHSVPLSAFEERGLSPNIQYKVTDDYTILAMVRQGLGVSVMYRLLLSSCGEGISIRPINELLERTVALAWADWNTLSIAAKQFIHFISQNLPSALTDINLDEQF